MFKILDFLEQRSFLRERGRSCLSPSKDFTPRFEAKDLLLVVEQHQIFVEAFEDNFFREVHRVEG